MQRSFLKLFLVATAIVTYVSCSNEKEEVTEEEIIIEEVVLSKSELPENAISAEEYLTQNGIVSKKESKTSLSLESRTNTVLVFEKYFVVYPPEWEMSDRLNYLQSVRKHREVFVVNDDCDFVDTWWIQVTRIYPPMPNKPKNVVVTASTSDTDLDRLDEDDEPGAAEGNEYPQYRSCDEVPLSEIYDGVVFDPFLDGGNLIFSGPTGGDTVNTPIQ